MSHAPIAMGDHSWLISPYRWECVNIGLSAVSLILTIVEIVKMAGETLTPWLMLATHVIKSTCAGAILALDVVVFTERKGGNCPLIGLGIDCAFL